MNERVGYRIEETILVMLILLNILDFLEWLPGDIDYIKKVISWTCLGYLLYEASLTQQFFGVRHNLVDLGLIGAYFMLVINKLISYAHVAIEEVNLLSSLYWFLISNEIMLTHLSFYIGGLIIFGIALYCTMKLEVRIPSLMHVIHEEGVPKTLSEKIERFSVIYAVFIGFFVIVFNLMMEWLAIAVDASILVVALLFYIFTLFRRHFRRFNPDSMIYKLGSVGEEFYSSFIELFHSKRKILMGVSGMLVLHLLTDVGIFIVPYIINIHDILYFEQLGQERLSIFPMMIKDLSLVSSLWDKLSIITVYLFNLIAILSLLILPGYIWYKLYKRQGFYVSHLKLSMFFVGIIIFCTAPAFSIRRITVPGLVGVDIVTQSIVSNTYLNVSFLVIVAMFCGAFVYAMSFTRWLKEKLILILIAIVDIFFGYYVYSYFILSLIHI